MSRLPAPEHGLILLENCRQFGTGKTIERIALGSGRLEANLLGLPVHHNKLISEFGQHTHGSTTAADNGTTATLTSDGAYEKKLTLIDVATRIANTVGNGRFRIDDPSALDGCLVAVSANSGGVSSLPQQQPKRGDDHCLSGAGLAGEGSESGAQRKPGRGDNTEVANGDLFDHEWVPSSDAGPRHPLTGKLNFLTRRSVNGPCDSRASLTGTGERRTTTRAPQGRS